jgi:hypothetical protein
MYLERGFSKKNRGKNLFFVCILKFSEENGRIRIRILVVPYVVADPYRIKMSWIRNTDATTASQGRPTRNT